jgi:hypothetical protein
LSVSNDMEKVLRQLATSSGVRIGTNAPFCLGSIFVRKIGFGDIPVVGMTVYCRPQDTRNLTPIARSFVYVELENAGIPNEAVEFTPSLGVNPERGNRQVMFVDINESSPTKGKRKRGKQYEFHFEIKKDWVKRFVWPQFGNPREGKFPEVEAK